MTLWYRTNDGTPIGALPGSRVSSVVRVRAHVVRGAPQEPSHG